MAVHDRHDHIKKDQVRLLFDCLIESLFAIIRSEYLVLVDLKPVLKCLYDVTLIINDQDFRLVGFFPKCF